MPLMLWRGLMLKSTLPMALSTRTLLGNPCTMLIDWVLLVGKPVPAQVTVAVTPEPLTLQPEISRLAALRGTLFASRSSIALGMLPPQSPVTSGEMQFPAEGNDAMDGDVTL